MKSGPQRPANAAEIVGSNAVRAYLIKYGAAQPVRLHDAPIEDVSGIGMINGIGNQL